MTRLPFVSVSSWKSVSANWHAWAGQADDVQAAAAALAAAVHIAIAAEDREIDKDAIAQSASDLVHLGDRFPANEQLREEYGEMRREANESVAQHLREETRRRLTISVVVKDKGSDTRTGSVALLGELKPGTVRVGLNVGGLFSEHWVSVQFLRAHGVSLSVGGADREWVEATFRSIRAEIRPSALWWRFVRSQVARVVYTLIGFVATFFGMEWLPMRPTGALGSLGIVLYCGAAAGFIVWQAVRAALPGFELLPAGATPCGTARIRWLGGVAGTLLLGVVASIIASEL